MIAAGEGVGATNSSLSDAACRCACAARAENSSSDSRSLSPNCSGRSSGTPIMAVPGHSPCRSGSPHGVRGTVHALSGFVCGFAD